MTLRQQLMVFCDEDGCRTMEGPFTDRKAFRRWLRTSTWTPVPGVTGRSERHRCPDHPDDTDGGAGVREPRRPVAPRPAESRREPAMVAR